MTRNTSLLTLITAALAAAVIVVASAQTPRNGAGIDRSDALKAAIRSGAAQRVILFLGDGMGDSEITIARNYAVGAAGRLAMDSLPFTGAYTTYALQESDPSKPDYVTDSAASGTGWSTGHKTSNGRISTAPATNTIFKTILEIAQERGLRTGDVTTAELTDATPAVLASHISSRVCQGPIDMTPCAREKKSAGGLGSIAEQEIDHHVDVLLGGGYSRFDQPTDAGPLVLQSAIAQGYRIVTSSAGLEHAERGRRVLGLFAPGNMTLEWNGAEALPYPANVRNPQVCERDKRPASEPSLAEMTAAAIHLLDSDAPGDAGFFLQVEGASIDKQDHVANPCAQIGETIAFDRAIQVGLDYARTHPDTLIVVTADHAHTSQIVPVPTDADHPAGLISLLRTADDAVMAVAYGNNSYHRSMEHTGAQVRIAAAGPQAANVTGVTDQTDLFRLFDRVLGRTAN